MMTIWVDADSCPRAVRAIVHRAARRVRIAVLFVANRELPAPIHPRKQMIVVGSEEGAADDYLAGHVAEGDLAVTRDIPLAARLVEKGALVIDDRGNTFTPENIRERLSVRNFMKELRESGLESERNRTMSRREIAAFANALDRTLTAYLREQAETHSSDP